MFIEIGISDKICRHAVAWMVAVVIGSTAAMAQTADVEAPGTKDVPVQALLKRIEELEASQKQMQQRIDQLTGPTIRTTPPEPPPAPHQLWNRRRITLRAAITSPRLGR